MSDDTTNNSGTPEDDMPRDMSELEEFAAGLDETPPPEEPADEPAEPTAAGTEDAPADDEEAKATADLEPEKAPEEPAAEATPDDQQVPTDDPLGKAYTFRGKTKTLREWAEQGDLEKVIFINAEQNAHMQQKWREKLQADEDAAKKAAAEAQQTQAASPEALKQESEHLKTHLAPKVLEMAKAGAIEVDFVEDYPVVATRMVKNHMETRKAAQSFDTRLKKLEQRHQEELAEIQAENEQRHVLSVVDKVAESGQAYSGLKDDGHRAEFFTWLADPQNPWGSVFAEVETTKITDEHMSGLYGEFLARTGKTAPTNTPPPRTPAAAAGASTGGGGRVTPPTLDEFDEFGKEMTDSRLA